MVDAARNQDRSRSCTPAVHPLTGATIAQYARLPDLVSQAEGLSQAALGVALGVSRQTINAIETGKYDPSLTLAIRLSRHFGRTVEEVFRVTEE